MFKVCGPSVDEVWSNPFATVKILFSGSVAAELVGIVPAAASVS